MYKLGFLFLASFLLLGCKAEEGENIHDVIMKVNEKALEEGLVFGSVDQPPLIEGDIIDDDDTKYKMELERQAADGEASPFDALNRGKWNGGIVPYTFGSVGSYARQQIMKAIAEYNKHTCIRFIPRTNQRDYVQFNRKGGCYSQIGRTGRGWQEISIGNGCENLGTVIHEMMHAIGFFHEQSRTDRDRYITINWGNIQPRMKYNFNMYRAGEADTHNEPYDKGSVMHYSRYAFSRNKRPTIVSKSNPNEKLGNYVGFTKTDIRQINKHYGCSGGGPKPPPKNCKDISSRCLANKWQCGTNNYVKKMCQKTCQLCKSF